MSITKTIGIFGGAGFLGRKICEVGVHRGYNVFAFSRTGTAPPEVKDTAWAKQVQWRKANVFDPSTYEEDIAKCDAVVHSIGILFENQLYKKLLLAISGIDAVCDFVKFLLGKNPMERTEFNTYQGIQRDSALTLARTFVSSSHSPPQPFSPAYVYISADGPIPAGPYEYIATKRDAETQLSQFPEFRTIAMRPGFMFDETHPGPANARDGLAAILKVLYGAKEAVAGNSISIANRLLRPPVLTSCVANSIYSRLESEFAGTVYLDDLAKENSHPSMAAGNARAD